MDPMESLPAYWAIKVGNGVRAYVVEHRITGQWVGITSSSVLMAPVAARELAARMNVRTVQSST